MPGTSIVFSACSVSFSCLRTKELGIVEEQDFVGLEYLCVLVADSVFMADSADYSVMQLYDAVGLKETSLIILLKGVIQ